MRRYALQIGGRSLATDVMLEVRSPMSGAAVSEVPLAGEAQGEAALRQALLAADAMRELPSHARAAALLALRDRLSEQSARLASIICEEIAKPIRDARAEVARALTVLTLSAEEAKRIGGETLPLDIAPGSEGRFAITRRYPVGVVLGITPYNFPLNLGMHKVGPALAAGNAILWKPSLIAPGAAFEIARLAQDCGLPEGALTVLTTGDDEAERLVCDERVRLVSFTGSARVGWRLRAVAGPKPVLLELGGSAPVIVCADADLERAAGRCAAGAFAFSGQVCISVQRILVDRAVFEPFAARLTAEVRALRAGDPASEETDYGPMTTEREAERIGEWLQEAIAGGARVLAGGGRKGLMVDATVLTQVPRDCRIWKEEAFGPVVCVEPYTHFDEALELANDGAYGLQAGIFTSDMPRVLRAFDSLQFGGVVWNDVPTYRADNMPYGGIRSSGLGREGVRYAIQEMTHLRLLALAP